MMEFWTALVALCGFFLIVKLYFAVQPKTSEPGPGMPGPRTVPVLGNLLEVATPQPHIDLMKLAKQHGPVYRLKLLDYYVVVVTDYNTMMDVLVRDSESYKDRVPPSFRLHEMSKHYYNISMQDTSIAWGASKKITQKSLKAYGRGLKTVEYVVNDRSQELIDVIKGTRQEPHDPRSNYYNYTLKIMYLFLLGDYISIDDPMFQKIKIMERLFAENLGSGGSGALLDAAPWTRFLGNQTWKSMCKGWGISKEVFEHYKAKLMASSDLQGEDLPVFPSMLKASSVLRDEKGEMLLNDKWCEGVLTDMFLAGIITTTTVMYILTMVMAHYPDIQRKVKEEIQEVAPHRQVALEDKKRLHYTRALIYEVLRNASITPNGLPHKATEDVMLGEYGIPKGTVFFLSQWALHHDEEFWDDPYEYKPERFLDENGKLVPADHPNRRHLMPFGAGLRVCLGETFAMTRLLLITSMLVQQFTLLPEGGHYDPGFCDPRGFSYGLILYPPPIKTVFADPSTPLPGSL